MPSVNVVTRNFQARSGLTFARANCFTGQHLNYKHLEPGTICTRRCVAPAAAGMPPNGSPPAAAPTWPPTPPA